MTYNKYEPFLALAKTSISDGSEYFLSHHNRVVPKPIRELLENEGGMSFDSGLYRLHTISSSAYWTEIASKYFSKYQDCFCCFGFDWLGRQYAMDLKDWNLIYLFDPSTGEAFELEQSLVDFHNDDLVNYRDETLSSKEFEKWLLEAKKPLRFDQCVGFKVSLFLGGIDRFENYELADLEVHWELSYQIFRKTKNLPEATLIDKVVT